MAERDQDAALRETAAHRGFRLVKSRRRKSGVGDYGRYGLADAKTGTECFGFGADGLTASAEDIAAYLRGSAAATWRVSADTTPDPPPATPARPAEAKPRERPKTARAAEAEPKRKGEPKPPPPPPTPKRIPPPPQLAVRPATKADAAAIAALLREMAVTLDDAAVAGHIAAQARAKTPLLVADRGGIVGVLDWHALPTLHLGAIGRIAVLLVAEKGRRRGTGRALVEAAAAAMAERDCTAIEAIGDIEIRNANGFFRATGFTQTSYRLVRSLSPRATSARRKQSAE